LYCTMAYTSEKQYPDVDLSHHISVATKRYNLSPLKGLQKYMKPGSIPFAGGKFHIL
jgi:hypothetical protein